MVARTQLLSSLILTLTLLFFAGSGAAEDVSSSCEAAIDRAAGNYSRCLLGAQSRNARRPDASRLESAEQRCTDRFDSARDRALARAEQRQETCTPFVEEIADRSVSYAERVATEASGAPALSLLFVQNGTSGTLSETTLTLTEVRPQTAWFTDRPHRKAGQMSTEEFLSLWDEEENSFADNPPNAIFTCEVEGEGPMNYVVELTHPNLVTDTVSYAVTAVGDNDLPETTITCEAEAAILIDGVTITCKGEYPNTTCVCQQGSQYEPYSCAHSKLVGWYPTLGL